MPRTAVVFCCDAAALPFAAFALGRLTALGRDRKFDLLIASLDALRLPHWLRALGVEAVQLDPGGDLQPLVEAGRGRLPKTTYLRLWLAEGMQQRGYDRVLYLDADVFPQTGALDPLLDLDLHGHVIAAVRDLSQWVKPDKPVFEFAANGHAGLPYFNSGVMLIDTARWQELDLTQRCLEEAAKRPVAQTHDQGLLNLALKGDWAELHPTWNWHMTREHHMLFALVKPRLLHFAGYEKPWGDDATQRLHDPNVVAAYATFLAERFPTHAFSMQDQDVSDRPWRDLAGAARHWFRLRGYLAKFQSELHVLRPARARD